MTTAYLVMVLDTSTSPPRIVGVDIFSEPNPTMKWGLYPVVIHQHTCAEGYGQARHRLLRSLDQPELAWVKPMIHQRRTVYEATP